MVQSWGVSLQDSNGVDIGVGFFEAIFVTLRDTAIVGLGANTVAWGVANTYSGNLLDEFGNPIGLATINLSGDTGSAGLNPVTDVAGLFASTGNAPGAPASIAVPPQHLFNAVYPGDGVLYNPSPAVNASYDTLLRLLSMSVMNNGAVAWGTSQDIFGFGTDETLILEPTAEPEDFVTDPVDVVLTEIVALSLGGISPTSVLDGTGNFLETGNAPAAPSSVSGARLDPQIDVSTLANTVYEAAAPAGTSYQTDRRNLTISAANNGALPWGTSQDIFGAGTDQTLVLEPTAEPADFTSAVVDVVLTPTLPGDLGGISGTSTLDAAGLYSETGNAPAAPSSISLARADPEITVSTLQNNNYEADTSAVTSYVTERRLLSLSAGTNGNLPWGTSQDLFGFGTDDTLAAFPGSEPADFVTDPVLLIVIEIVPLSLGGVPAPTVLDGAGSYFETGNAPAAPASASPARFDPSIDIASSQNTVYEAAAAVNTSYQTDRRNLTISAANNGALPWGTSQDIFGADTDQTLAAQPTAEPADYTNDIVDVVLTPTLPGDLGGISGSALARDMLEGAAGALPDSK